MSCLPNTPAGLVGWPPAPGAADVGAIEVGEPGRRVRGELYPGARAGGLAYTAASFGPTETRVLPRGGSLELNIANGAPQNQTAAYRRADGLPTLRR